MKKISLVLAVLVLVVSALWAFDYDGEWSTRDNDCRVKTVLIQESGYNCFYISGNGYSDTFCKRSGNKYVDASGTEQIIFLSAEKFQFILNDGRTCPFSR